MDGIGRAVAVAGALQIALGAWQFAAPGQFFATIGGFGPENAHYLRDVSTIYLAMGVALVVAAYRRDWRVPVLALATMQYAVHAVNHLIDVRAADPGWVGPFDAALVAGGAMAFAVLLRVALGRPSKQAGG